MVRTLSSHARLLAIAATLGVFAACSSSNNPTLSLLTVSPSTVSVAVGHTTTLSVSGTLSDGSSQAITDAVWSSSSAAIASVTQSGVVTGVATGSATITATSSGLSATATITVTAPTVVSIAATPVSTTLAVGGTQAISVAATFSDTSHTDVTSAATYTSSAATVATVSAGGLITAVADGTATIAVSYQGKSASVSVTVSTSAPTLSSIAVTPATASLAIGATQQLAVSGTFSDSSTSDLTSASTFTSDTPAVATVSASGLITAVAAGTALVTASDQTKTATVAVTVLAANLTLMSIDVGPLAVTLTAGATDAIIVTGTFSDGTMANETSHSTFMSDTPAVATVSAGGLITAVAAGTANVSVSDQAFTISIGITVNPATLQSIAVTPNPLTVAPGQIAALVVTGTFNVGPTQVLTSSATFTSMDPTVATVDASGNVSGVMLGSTSINVSVTPTGGTPVTGSATVNVQALDQSIVFSGIYGNGVTYEAFGGSNSGPVIDPATLAPSGKASLKIVGPAGGYVGGAFVNTTGPLDLSSYDSLTFYAMASSALTYDKVGFGNNNGQTMRPDHSFEWDGVALTTSWQKFVLPLPDPSKLTAEDGLFYFADGANDAPATIWLADIQFTNVGAAVTGAPTVTWNTTAKTVASGGSYTVNGNDLFVTYTIGSTIKYFPISPLYFTFSSDNTAAVSVDGAVSDQLDAATNASANSATANITATLVAAVSSNQLAITVPGTGTPQAPTTLPPVPSHPAGANVISLYSSVTGGYTGTASDYSACDTDWLAPWSQNNNPTAGGNPFPITVGANSAAPRKYVVGSGGASYIGIEFLGTTNAGCPNTTGTNEIDASSMQYFHIDVWTLDIADNFQVQVVNNPTNGGASTQGTATITAGSTPALATGTWLSYDLPLNSTGFPNGTWPTPPVLNQVGQFVLQAPNGGTFFVDNLYFWSAAASGGGSGGGSAGGSAGGSGGGSGGGTASNVPPTAAPTPSQDPTTVYSIWSDTYAGTAGDDSSKVDSYSASCLGPPGSTVSTYTIGTTTHKVLEYTITGAPTFAVIDLLDPSGGTPNPPDSALCNASGATQTAANLLTPTGSTFIHVDVWSPGGSGNFQVHLVQADLAAPSLGTIAGPGSAAGASAGSDEASGALTVTAGSWNSFDIAFSTLGPPTTTVSNIGLVKFFTTDSGTYFIDNIYFHQ